MLTCGGSVTIVSAAGISKNTMYSRFSSKDDLFRALIGRQIERVAETRPLGSPEAVYDLEQGLKNYANRTLEVSLEREFIEVNRLIYSEARRFPELGAAAARRTRSPTSAAWSESRSSRTSSANGPRSTPSPAATHAPWPKC